MADPKVLEAQEWVNKTYTDVADGYVSCPEDGSTGWATVLSLTQALQHELGVSPTVQNFGPGTFSRVKARNLQPGEETNKNIVRIYNYALWCKGYSGSGNAYTWDSTAEASLFALGQHMGGERNSLTINPDADLWARITKSMLRMDQFRVISGGSSTTRHFQQYLNSRYVKQYRIPAMEIVPCDGNYDRVTQQGLMMAIQLEIGLDPAAINGNFGDGTKAGLAANTLVSGDQSDLAYLLHAACHFNSPTYAGYEKIRFPWSDVHADGGGYKVTADTATWLRAFQDFAQIAVNGMANFQTWAQLLVSMGDSSREAKASDTIVELTPERITALRLKGFQAVGRYLDEHLAPSDPYYLGKALKAGEAKRIVDSGLALIPLFQYNGTQVWNFDYERGRAQGTAAHAKAVEHGIPPGSCIYFAVDYDAQDHEITSNVIPYFTGVRDALGGLGSRYQFGVYGTRNVCARVSLEAGARWSFVAGMSWGYSGNLGFPLPVNWSLNQIFQHDPDADPPTGFTDGVIAPIGLDRNVWRDDSDAAVTALDRDDRYDDVTELVDFVAALEAAAREYHGPNADNVELIRNVVLTFFRQHKYTDMQWNIFGGIDQNFIEFAADKGLKLEGRTLRGPKDPVSYRSLDIEHMMAACQGHLKYYENGDRTDLGDGTGWLGDLLTLYAEWRNDYSDLSGAEFCSRYLGNLHTSSAYGEDDWRADADAFNLAGRLHEASGLAVSQALRTYFLVPNLNDLEFRFAQRRFSSLYKGRFGGSRTTLTDRVRNALLGIDSSIAMNIGHLVLGRDLILDGNLPGMIPESELNSYVSGYTDKLIADLKAEPSQP